MKITNRQAYHEYQILEVVEAGLTLLGSEVKMVKGGRMNLSGAFVRIIGSEVYLVNAEIPLYPYSRPEGYDPRRSRKLLLHKHQIIALKTKIVQSNLTLVPLSCYTKGGFVKLEIGIGKGRKAYQKKEKKKREDIKKDVERELRGKY